MRPCRFSVDGGGSIPLLGAVSYSMGSVVETSQRYGYDYSKAPQTLVYRKRNTAKTATVNLAFNPALCFEYELQPMDYVAQLEGLCGKKGVFVWEGEAVGSFVVQSISFSADADCYQIFGAMSVTLTLTEAYVRRRNLAEETAQAPTPVVTL